jgi:hypothetical protein
MTYSQVGSARNRRNVGLWQRPTRLWTSVVNSA